MKHHTPEQTPGHPTLSTALADLQQKSVQVKEEMDRVLGLLRSIHTSKDAHDLLHRLRSIIGRDRSIKRMLRQWITLLEPIETIAESIQVHNGETHP